MHTTYCSHVLPRCKHVHNPGGGWRLKHELAPSFHSPTKYFQTTRTVPIPNATQHSPTKVASTYRSAGLPTHSISHSPLSSLSLTLLPASHTLQKPSPFGRALRPLCSGCFRTSHGRATSQSRIVKQLTVTYAAEELCCSKIQR